MKRAFTAALGIAAMALIALAGVSVAQQTQGVTRLPQLRFNPAAMPARPGQSRNMVYTLGRLQHHQMGLNNVRAINPRQAIIPPAPVSNRLSK